MKFVVVSSGSLVLTGVSFSSSFDENKRVAHEAIAECVTDVAGDLTPAQCVFFFLFFTKKST